MYPLLRRGDRLPTVAVAQILVNRTMTSGTYIDVDGRFGRNTREAVRNFQRSQRTLGVDGVIGQNTWAALTKKDTIKIIDSVDVTNPSDQGVEDNDIRVAGGNPIVNYGMSNGVRAIVQKIQGRANGADVGLLRFHGHGLPGYMGLSSGTGFDISSGLNVDQLNAIARSVTPLGAIFTKLGSAELHGCRVGAGLDGKKLITALARAWKVPVTAGVRSQYSGGMNTFHFEGRTITAFPNGGNLKSWVRSLPAPEIHGMSVSR